MVWGPPAGMNRELSSQLFVKIEQTQISNLIFYLQYVQHQNTYNHKKQSQSHKSLPGEELLDGLLLEELVL